MLTEERLRMFINLCDEAMTARGTTPDASAWEPLFVAVLSFVLEHPEGEDVFCQHFLQWLSGEDYRPIALIEFCMYRLRWAAVRDAASHRAATVERSLNKQWMKRILSAYEDSWLGRLCYDYYDDKPKNE